MKILCTKKEFAKLVVNCAGFIPKSGCAKCILYPFCEKEYSEKDDLGTLPIVRLAAVMPVKEERSEANDK